MPKNHASSTTVKNSSPITTANHNMEGKGFKPYLEAVETASQRTRSILYALMIAMIAIFAAYRNTATPDWIDARLQQLQMAYACLQNGTITSEGCESAREYAGGFMYQSTNGRTVSDSVKEYSKADSFLRDRDISADRSEAGRELRYQIDMLIKQRTENLSIKIPILGVVMDMNDLGWISGITLLVLLYIFYLGLSREADNLNRACRRAQQPVDKDHLELLLMVQVFSAPPKAKTGTNKLFYVFFTIPFLLQFCISWTDMMDSVSRQVGKTLLGTGWYWVQMSTEALFLIGIGFVSLLTARQWSRIEDAMKGIRKAYQDAGHAS